MPTQADYDKTLDKLAALLKRKPLTARAIAEALDCCKPVAYQRIQALRNRGESLFEVPRVRESKTGPMSKAYGIR